MLTCACDVESNTACGVNDGAEVVARGTGATKPGVALEAIGVEVGAGVSTGAAAQTAGAIVEGGGVGTGVGVAASVVCGLEDGAGGDDGDGGDGGAEVALADAAEAEDRVEVGDELDGALGADDTEVAVAVANDFGADTFCLAG